MKIIAKTQLMPSAPYAHRPPQILQFLRVHFCVFIFAKTQLMVVTE